MPDKHATFFYELHAGSSETCLHCHITSLIKAFGERMEKHHIAMTPTYVVQSLMHAISSTIDVADGVADVTAFTAFIDRIPEVIKENLFTS